MRRTGVPVRRGESVLQKSGQQASLLLCAEKVIVVIGVFETETERHSHVAPPKLFVTGYHIFSAFATRFPKKERN